MQSLQSWFQTQRNLWPVYNTQVYKKKEKSNKWNKGNKQYFVSMMSVGWQFLHSCSHQNFPVNIMRIWKEDKCFSKCLGSYVSHMM